jgi:hypothetical protein
LILREGLCSEEEFLMELGILGIKCKAMYIFWVG